MKLFYLLLRSSWRATVASIAAGVVSGVASLCLITLIHRVLVQRPATPAWLGVAFAALCGVVLLTRVVSQVMLARLSQRTASHLRMRLSRKIMSSPLASLEKVGTHRLLAALTEDVTTVTTALCGFPKICANGMILVCGVLYLGWLSPALALCAVGVAAAGVASYLVTARCARKYLNRGREAHDELIKQLRAMAAGIKELKSNEARRDDFTNNVLAPADDNVRHQLATGQSIHAVALSWGRVMVFIGLGLLLFVWPMIQAIEVAALTGYTLTILYLMVPLDIIVEWLPHISRASVSLRKIDRLGLLFSKGDTAKAAVSMTGWQRLDLRGVTYDYRGGDGQGFAFGPVDLSLQRGEIVFVTGGNGSGKTTLAKLMTGLYTPREGEITLDGRVIDDGNRENFRQLFSTVFVEGNLFDRLLGVGSPQQNEQLAKWLEILQLESKVDVASGKLACDEVSRGQQKRLALLTACLDDRPIFVFDEWAAEQDPTFKHTFYKQIVHELRRQGKTILAITHDDRYFDQANRIIRLGEGRLETVRERSAA